MNISDDGDLLVPSEGRGTGKLVYFSKAIEKHKFSTKFRDAYLLDLGIIFSPKVTKFKRKRTSWLNTAFTSKKDIIKK